MQIRLLADLLERNGLLALLPARRSAGLYVSNTWTLGLAVMSAGAFSSWRSHRLQPVILSGNNRASMQENAGALVSARAYLTRELRILHRGMGLAHAMRRRGCRARHDHGQPAKDEAGYDRTGEPTLLLHTSTVTAPTTIPTSAPPRVMRSQNSDRMITGRRRRRSLPGMLICGTLDSGFTGDGDGVHGVQQHHGAADPDQLLLSLAFLRRKAR